MIRGCPIQQTASTSETQVTLFLKLKGVKSLELSLQTWNRAPNKLKIATYFPIQTLQKKCRETAFSNDFSSYIIFMMLGADHLTLEGGGGVSYFEKKIPASACR